MLSLGALKRYSGPTNMARNIVWQHSRFRSDYPLIFVVGAPRSGTTLLQMLLSQHSRLFSIESETGIFTYTDLFSPKRGHFGLPPNELRSLMASAKSAPDLLERGARAVAARRGLAQSMIFVEKTPQHCLYARRIAGFFPNALFVEIVRDGRDCYRSAISHGGVSQSRSVADFARYWARCTAAMLSPAFARVAGNRHVRVRYEDLCADAASEISIVMEGLGLPFEPSQIEAQGRSGDVRASRQEFERLGKEISDRSVGNWRDEMDGKSVEQFEEIAGRELWQLGYL